MEKGQPFVFLCSSLEPVVLLVGQWGALSAVLQLPRGCSSQLGVEEGNPSPTEGRRKDVGEKNEKKNNRLAVERRVFARRRRVELETSRLNQSNLGWNRQQQQQEQD